MEKAMKRIHARAAALALAAALFALPAVASAQAPDMEKILQRVDDMGNFENGDFSAEITVVTSEPGEENEVIVARYFRRDKANQMVLVILKPDVQKGQAYLALGDDLWFYDPESRKFAFSSFKDRFADSGAQNSDFSSSKLHEDYTVESAAEGKLGKNEVWIAELKAKDKSVAVDKRKLWITKDINLVLKEEQYSLSGKLRRTILIPSYQKVGSNYVPATMLEIDNVKIGEKAQITFKDVSVSKLPDSVFTKAYLERVSQ
jgi:outer membrane lipoprotein-sorting protein